ncbi:hypothetical protein P7C70_g73, partial [Phenoliferia sp. Uapishka_3]
MQPSETVNPIDPAYRARLDPEYIALYDSDYADHIDSMETSLEEKRRVGLIYAGSGRAQEVASIKDITAPGPHGPIPIKMYYPTKTAEEEASAALLPILVHYRAFQSDLSLHLSTLKHLVADTITIFLTKMAEAGRDLAEDAALSAMYCNTAHCIVASVDYRLAPERFATKVTTSCQLHKSASELGADSSRFAVGGESAGGNLSAVVSLMARDADIKSIKETYLLDKLDWRKDWRASPLLAPSLSNLPPALVSVAELDLLRDEGLAYAMRLANAGVDVTTLVYPKAPHVFYALDEAMAVGRKFQADSSKALRTAFWGA